MPSTLLVDDQGDRLLISLNRPDTRNAIDLDMVRELHDVCADLERNPRIALITGEGKLFASGADIAQLRDRRQDDALSGINSRLFTRLHALPMPTIALMHGFALGGGAELSYACDFRIGTPDLKIGNPEPALGIVAAAGATWRLAELVGEPLAKEVLLTGRVLDATAARSAGLLNEVVEHDALLEAGHAMADRIATLSPLAIRLTKAAFSAPRGAHPVIDELAQAILFETADKHQRMTTFLDRRSARS